MRRRRIDIKTVAIGGLALVWVAAGAAVPAGAQDAAVTPDSVAGKTAQLLQALLRFDTSNPPGRTLEQAQYLDGLFRAIGASTDIVPTPAEGQVHFIARLKGDGSKRPVLIAAHSDVVPVERQSWTVEPFAGVVKDGFVLGRGAMDFKGGQAVFARAVMMLAENKVPLARDVIFLAEANEEAGEYNTIWLAKDHWDKIDAEFGLNEGGWIFQDEKGRTRQVNIATRDKISTLIKLTATGRSTHASRPMPESAITHLTVALAKIAAWDTGPTLIAQTREYFRALSHTAEPPLADHLRTLADSTDPAALRQAGQKVVELGSYPLLWHALMRNTVAPTMLKAGIKENVIPGSAEAILNVRLIPGSTPWEIMDQLRTVIDDPTVKVQLGGSMSEEQARRFYNERTNLAASGTDTDLYKALVDSARKTWPGAEIVSALFEAGTDASAWRSRGVPIYGIYPYPLDNETLERMHGNDERISINSLGEGTQMIYDALVAVARK